MQGGDGRTLDRNDNHGVAADTLRSYIERLEHLEEEKRGTAALIADVKKEAKSAGFDIPAINLIIKERRKEQDELDEFYTIVDIYRDALA